MAENKGRGFAAMDEARQREIASKGGRAAHVKGTAHRFTPEEARAAGRKGGQAAHVKGTAHEFTPEEARIAGRKGGQAARQRGGPRTSNPAERNNGTHAGPIPTGSSLQTGNFGAQASQVQADRFSAHECANSSRQLEEQHAGSGAHGHPQGE
jgi:general stress protein YciG